LVLNGIAAHAEDIAALEMVRQFANLAIGAKQYLYHQHQCQCQPSAYQKKDAPNTILISRQAVTIVQSHFAAPCTRFVGSAPNEITEFFPQAMQYFLPFLSNKFWLQRLAVSTWRSLDA
jgi:hypothetical protein